MIAKVRRLAVWAAANDYIRRYRSYGGKDRDGPGRTARDDAREILAALDAEKAAREDERTETEARMVVTFRKERAKYETLLEAVGEYLDSEPDSLDHRWAAMETAYDAVKGGDDETG